MRKKLIFRYKQVFFALFFTFQEIRFSKGKNVVLLPK